MHPPVREKVTFFSRRSQEMFYFIFGSQIPILQLFYLFFGYDTKFGPIDRIKLVPLKNILRFDQVMGKNGLFTPCEQFRATCLGP